MLLLCARDYIDPEIASLTYQQLAGPSLLLRMLEIVSHLLAV